MKIYAIFGVVDGEIELLDAWDEGSMDMNPEGYQEKLAKLKRSKCASNVTEVTLDVNGEAIRKAVFPEHKITAKVT